MQVATPIIEPFSRLQCNTLDSSYRLCSANRCLLAADTALDSGTVFAFGMLGLAIVSI